MSFFVEYDVIKFCESERFCGFDFVFLVEGLFCDMIICEVMFLCEDDDDMDCFYLMMNK